jgi:chaperone modulatory protein CbpM
MSTTVTRMTIGEVCECEGVTRTLLVQLVEYDIARPLGGGPSRDWVFDVSGVAWIKRALRIQRDFDLDWAAVAVMVDLLREREALQQENRSLRQRLERFLAGSDGQDG